MLYNANTSKAMDSVRTIMYQYYRQAFVVQDKPYASAISIVALCLIPDFHRTSVCGAEENRTLRIGRGVKWKQTIVKKHVVTHLLLILGSIVMLFPFLWMILSSFKTVGEQMSIPMKILPGSFGYLENYKQALEAVPFLRLYLNTILMILGRVICAVIFSSMAGYGFARMEFPFKRLLFTLVLMQMMVPGQIFIVPQYMMLSKIKLLNTVFALIFPALVSAFGTFLLRQQHMALPKELEEAAVIDGCNPWQVFTKIMVPVTRSSLASLAILPPCLHGRT